MMSVYTSKMKKYTEISIVNFCKNKLSAFSITTELGDLLDYAYFCSSLGISNKLLEDLFQKHSIKYIISRENVLVFSEKCQAEKAIKILNSFLNNQSSLVG